ncbi:hypothetical protein CBR_g46649 [Chara braunii]|uniref:Uncharacterized protein n=1 Tax=Chara braunii TaxID=69332 RepID=A0A388M0U7_CHABU|nr:hypothetical protein CBR_g46649 [Chara braunii]|eukprot:GBG88161.1 hypothetical protein CBR_g46649 [Chara braunii]
MKTAGVLLVLCMMMVVGGSFATPMQVSFSASGDAGSSAENTTEVVGEYSFTLPDYAAKLLRGDSARTTTEPPTVTVRGNPCEVECKCELVKCQGRVVAGQISRGFTLVERREQLRGMTLCSGAYEGCEIGCTRYNM